jgi:hypothetical protein
MSNPYSPGANRPVRVLANAQDVPATSQNGLRGGVRVGGVTRKSDLPAFGANGEINALSKKDLVAAITHLVKEASAETTVVNPAMTREAALERKAHIVEAFHDRNPQKLQVLGEVYSDSIWETLGRQGFARKLFAVQNVTPGTPARVKVRKKDVVAYQVTSDVKVQPQVIRQTYIYPPEYYINAQIKIEDKEIAQASADILDEKFQDGLEAIMRREDLISRALMVQAATSHNDLTLFPSFTPSVLSTMRTAVDRWGIPPATLLISFDIWQDITSHTEFVDFFDQVSKHELVLEGRLGSILGMEILTDGYRMPTLQVLQPGEVFVVGTPVTLGTICQVKELTSVAIDFYNQGMAARGWFLESIQAQVLANSRAVSRGIRV